MSKYLTLSSETGTAQIHYKFENGPQANTQIYYKFENGPQVNTQIHTLL